MEQHQAEGLGPKEAEHEVPNVAVERAEHGDHVVSAQDSHERGGVPDLEAALLLLQHARVQVRVQRHDQILANYVRPEDGAKPATQSQIKHEGCRRHFDAVR